MEKIDFPATLPVTSHTKYVTKGTTFVAIKGQKEDGNLYIPEALKKGASTIIIQNDTLITKNIEAEKNKYSAKIVKVENTRKALATLSSKKSEYAHKKLKIIGITGTKGKTSTSFILEHILSKSGYKTALISTVYNKILDQIFESKLTTDQPDYLHMFFKLCVKNKVEFVIMEVAAQALSLHRVNGIEFEAIGFTNFDQEHGEFYKNLNDYFDAKNKIFKQLKPGGKVFANADNIWGKKILKNNPDFLSFGIENDCHKNLDLSAKIKNDLINNLEFTISKNKQNYEYECPYLFGKFNIYNALTAIGISNYLGITLKKCSKYLKSFIGIPGRLEPYQLTNGAQCFIDYAHNPSSFEAVLSTLRPMTNHLIVIFGAGGERDKEKRPIMGKIASRIADLVILTSDNPRSEKPETIIDNISSGIPKACQSKIIKKVDRKQAILSACKLAKKNSIIALLGKGPEEYQIIGNTIHKFSEKEIILGFK